VSEAGFVTIGFRSKVEGCVQGCERATRAELVVAIRGRSATHEGATHWTGAALALLLLLVLLFHPREFSTLGMPAALATVYLLGVFLARRSPHVQRWLTPSATLTSATRAHAAMSFIEQGVSKTRERTGVLVFVSLLERRVCVLTDVGLSADVLGAPWTQSLAGLSRSVEEQCDPEAFLAALQGLGEALAQAYPSDATDRDELSNAPRVEE
jgi:putative membrane protein